MTPHEITITIRKPEDLFRDFPDENPMQPDWEADSGMQRVADFLKTRRLRKGILVTIQHPDTLVIPPDGMEKLHQAIDRYCDARIAENARERKFTIQTGLTGFSYSIVVSVLIFLVMGWLVPLLALPAFLNTVLTGLYTIGAWAIIWGPIEAIFYDWLPNWTAIRVYRAIKRGEFILKPIPMSATMPVF
ncbi:MAG TPA: hypothetical protein VER79_02455, partial [Candidatus Limnocylindrales bacterium]|nr:hypothetical protein [Candidatus Limnocylindrales bacterium]